MSIYKCVSAVLLLGNVTFDGSTYGNETPCGMMNKDILPDIAELIGLEVEKL